MRKIKAKELFRDDRGSIENISAGTAWREVNRFYSKEGMIRGGHYHKETEELLFLIEGQIEITCEDVRTGKKDEMSVARNEGVLIMPYEKHTVRIVKPTTWLAFLTKEYGDQPDVFE